VGERPSSFEFVVLWSGRWHDADKRRCERAREKCCAAGGVWARLDKARVRFYS
jgi:hypothetical protein